jgi:hypothetical protein
MSYNGQNAYMDNDVGSVPVRGELNASPGHTTTYTITVTGPTGSADASVTVKVNGQPLPQPEGSFGKQYEDLIPQDATLDEYDPQRFALITGAVKDSNSSPLADVAVTIHRHQEYGTVATDVEGRFSIPVEGGGWSNVVYRKKGFIPAQRKVYVPWNDTAVAETVVIITEDNKASTITFDGNQDTVVTHQSSPVSDEAGPRSVTMVLTGDNQAYLVNEKGNDVQPLNTITTRATEYTTPESMPAKLPPNSAFTYCAEFSIDGARRVRFKNRLSPGSITF